MINRIGAPRTRIAISYRREDSIDITGRIFDRLVTHYGRDSVFRDIDNIPAGFDFREHITANLNQADVLVVIVGPRWQGEDAKGEIRIAKENDYVRFEIETALKRRIPILPLLVGRTEMPQASHLPESIQSFAFRSALQIDSATDFDHHLTRLLRTIDRITGVGHGSSGTSKQSEAGATNYLPKRLQTTAGLQLVGGFLIAHGVIRLVWFAAHLPRQQLNSMLQEPWWYSDPIFGIFGVVIGAGIAMGKQWGRPSGTALCLLGLVLEVLWLIEFGDKTMSRAQLAFNIGSLPAFALAAIYLLFRWPISAGR